MDFVCRWISTIPSTFLLWNRSSFSVTAYQEFSLSVCAGVISHLECCSFTEIRSHEQFQRVSETVLSSLFSTFWKSIDGYYQTFMPLIQKLTIYQYCSLHSFSNNESLLKPNVLIFYSISKASTCHTTWGRNRYCIEFSFNY